MKRIVLIEICDFKQFPTGGQLSFAKSVMNAWSEELSLAGCTIDKWPVGVWGKRDFEGVEFNFLSVGQVSDPAQKSFIPRRIWGFWHLFFNRKKLNAENFDVILISSPEVLFALEKKWLHKVFLILPGLENPLRISRYFYGKWFAEIYDFFLYRRISKINTILAAADRKHIAEFVANSRGLLSEKQVLQQPTRYSEDIYYPRPIAEARQILNIPMNKTVVITVGRLNKFKGGEFMLECFAKFAENKPESVFYFIGDGEEKEHLLTTADKFNVADKVFLCGRKTPEEIAIYLNSADLFIMGSYKEGWSTSLLEAVACGTRVCVTDFSSAEEMVHDNVNGFVVKSRNVNEFTEKMIDALNLEQKAIDKAAVEITSLAFSKLKSDLSKHWES